MSLLVIVFAPVLIVGLAFVALLLGAATAGAWEAVEERQQGRPPVAGRVRPHVAPPEEKNARAA